MCPVVRRAAAVRDVAKQHNRRTRGGEVRGERLAERAGADDDEDRSHTQGTEPLGAIAIFTAARPSSLKSEFRA